jgi:ClpP class serine protease
MHKVAQGRVWSGQQAKERGLVDEIGGFARAVEMAKEAAGIEDEFVRLVDVRGPLSPLARLGIGASASASSGDGGALVSALLTSGEPLAMCELDPAQGFATSSGIAEGSLSPLQKMIAAGIVDATSRMPGGAVLRSTLISMMDSIYRH